MIGHFGASKTGDTPSDVNLHLGQDAIDDAVTTGSTVIRTGPLSSSHNGSLGHDVTADEVGVCRIFGYGLKLGLNNLPSLLISHVNDGVEQNADRLRAGAFSVILGDWVPQSW